MKLISSIIFLVFFVIALVIGKYETHGQKYFLKVAEKCMEESQVKLEYVKLSLMGVFVPDQPFKEYLHCFAKTVGLVKFDNSMDNNRLQKMASRIVGRHLAAKIRKDCDNTLYDAVNTVYYTFECYINKIKETVPSGDANEEDIWE